MTDEVTDPAGAEREQYKSQLVALIQSMPAHNPLTITCPCMHVHKFRLADLAHKIQADTGEGKRWLDWYIQVVKPVVPAPQP